MNDQPMTGDHRLIEWADPAQDGRAFRRCLGQFTTGVTVMTARHGEQRAGMSVNSFAALSLDPPLVLWSIRRESGSLPIFRGASGFAVNVLAADQVGLSALFASSATDKFGQTTWRPGRHGAPLLDGTIAQLECRLEQLIEGGDHLIIVGRVEHCARFIGEPLLFSQGRYAATQEHPSLAQTPAGPLPTAPAYPGDVEQDALLRLLHFTSNRMSAWFAAERQAEGLTVGQFRVYGWLRQHPYTAEQLGQLAYLGSRDADDTVASLREIGHIARDGDGVLQLTTAGRERADAVVRRVMAFEAGLLLGQTDADLAATRRVLGTLARHPRGGVQAADAAGSWPDTSVHQHQRA